MSKASNRWIAERYYTSMGLEAPTDVNLLQFNNAFITDFLAPATFIVSGKTREEFDFAKAEKPGAESFKYLSSCAGADQVNQLISILCRRFNTPIWTHFLKDLVPLYEYNGLLSGSVLNAVNKYMETHEIKYATYDVDACDIMIVVDKESGKPITGYPENCYIYSQEEVDHYGIKHGGATVVEVCEKAWYRYDEWDKHLIDNMTYDVKQLLHAFTVPTYDKMTGEAINTSFTYLDDDKPPAEIAELYSLLPEALITEYGDPVNALAAYVRNNPGQITTQEAKDYIEDYEAIYVHTQPSISPSSGSIKLPGTVCVHPNDTDATIEELSKLGYEIRDGSDVIRSYCVQYGLDEGITVSDLLKFMNDDADDFKPVPFDKEAHAKEVINAVNWDEVKADAIASIDRAAIVKEELEKIGVDPETLARINIAISTGSAVDISPTNYIDKFEEAGAVMLHGVRELLSKDASLENRQRVQDVIYAYLVIMMGEEKKLPTVIQFTADKRDHAQGDAKDLIEKAMEVLRK